MATPPVPDQRQANFVSETARRSHWPAWYRFVWTFCRDVVRLVLPLRVNLIIVALLATVFWFPDQAHDIFVGLTEDVQNSWSKVGQLATSAAVLGLLLWFTSESLLIHLGKPVRDIKFNRCAREFLPILLAAAPFAIVALAFLATRAELFSSAMPESVVKLRRRMAAAAIIVGTFAVALVVLACALSAATQTPNAELQPKSRFGKIARPISQGWTHAARFTAAHRFIWATAATVALVAGSTALLTPKFASLIGPAAMLCYAAVLWCLLFHPLLLLLGHYRVPLLTLLIVLGAIFGLSDCNDNHAIRLLDRPLVRPLPTAAQALNEWLATRPDYVTDKPYPVFIVAAEGGGIRNAYWTAITLAHLADRHYAFRGHLFAVSGVSGGSVGAIVYAALVRAQEGAGRKREDLVPRARRILSEDLLSPVVAKGAIADLAQQFLPACKILDRAITLEQGLEWAWNKYEADFVFNLGFYGLRPEDNSTNTPYLVLNTTEVETGQRVPVAHLIPDSTAGGSMKVFADVVNSDIRLSTAAFLSARFPVVTPAGSVRFGVDGRKYRYVDGGYFDNSATATVYDMLRELTAPESTAAATRTGRAANVVFYVIRIRYVESAGTDAGHSAHWLGDPLSPVRALLKTREARAEFSRVQLDRLLLDSALARRPVHDAVMPFEVGDAATHLPLGWSLSAAARDTMDAQLPDRGGGGGSEDNRQFSDMIGLILNGRN